MELGLVSDIHSNIRALEQVLQRLGEGPDRILCAGDLVGYYLHPNQVVEEIRRRNIESVVGNHDYALVNWPPEGFNPVAMEALEENREKLSDQNREFLEELPGKIELELAGRRIMIVHGSPRDPNEYVYPGQLGPEFLDRNLDKQFDLLVLGHTHVPFTEQIAETLAVNPGSVGQPRDGDPRASYATVDLESMEPEIHRTGYDIDKVAQEVIQHGLPEQLADRLIKGR